MRRKNDIEYVRIDMNFPKNFKDMLLAYAKEYGLNFTSMLIVCCKKGLEVLGEEINE